MKKFSLILLAAIAALPFLHSCNDSDVEGADCMTLVTILNPGGIASGYYFQDDNGKTLNPAQFAVSTGSYNPKDGQRAFIYYSMLDEKSTRYDYNIKLYGITEILTKEVESIDSSNEAEFGNDPIVLAKLNGDTYDCLISGGYFTCSFLVQTAGGEQHKISLVRSGEDADDISGYTTLELRHKSSAVATGEETGSSMVSFKLNAYDPALNGGKGLKIVYKNFDGKMTYALINYTKK